MFNMLHIINKSPFESNGLTSCLRLALPGCSILLIEDAVIAALSDSSFTSTIQAALKKHSFYVLKPDLEARGLLNKTIKEIQLIDYEGFVDLTLKHSPIQSWS